jgi:hypothetical protein
MGTPEARTTFRCSFAAEARGDPMQGTASPAVGMLLIEQPGGWGRRALVESRLDPAVGAAVSARAVAVGLRVLLIRRTGRSAVAKRRRWAVVDCRPGQEVTWWGDFGADPELLSLPLDGSGGTASNEPCYLVCTHGRHDACCAIRGRPVAQALDRLRAEQAWECSHVGGDRFAANLVALPHGLYYGRVDAHRISDIVAAQERGEVALPMLRGRTTFAPAAQAAQAHARSALGELAINALNPVETSALGDGHWEVRLRHEPHDLVTTVRQAVRGGTALLTCHATHGAHPPYFEVSNLRPAD